MWEPLLSHHIPTHLYSRPAWRIMTNKSSLHPVQEAAGDRYSEHCSAAWCVQRCLPHLWQLTRCRLEKLNDLIVKSKPLRSWTSRSVGDVEVEITTRRTLSFLSGLVRFSLKCSLKLKWSLKLFEGGDVVPLLNDILYPNEKEILGKLIST